MENQSEYIITEPREIAEAIDLAIKHDLDDPDFDSRWLSIDEFSQYTGIKPMAVRRRIERGRLEATDHGSGLEILGRDAKRSIPAKSGGKNITRQVVVSYYLDAKLNSVDNASQVLELGAWIALVCLEQAEAKDALDQIKKFGDRAYTSFPSWLEFLAEALWLEGHQHDND